MLNESFVVVFYRNEIGVNNLVDTVYEGRLTKIPFINKLIQLYDCSFRFDVTC